MLGVELPSLWRFALQVTRDKHDAEDLVQRTCVRAIEQCHRYKEVGKPKSWLFKIAQNLWTNELRSKAIRERGGYVQPSEHGEEAAIPDNETPESQLELQDIVTAVEALPEAQRMVMILVCVNGFSYSETASILEVPIGTVMSRLARARLSIGEQFLNDDSNPEQTAQTAVAESNVQDAVPASTKGAQG